MDTATSKHFNKFFLLLLVNYGSDVLASSLPHVWSSVDGYKTVCENELVYLTCWAHNSRSLIWSSREYIGDSTAIEFNRLFDRLGKGKFISLPNGRATLSQLTKIENTSLLSDLKIQIPNNFSSTEVACMNSHGETETKTFILAEEPPQPPICQPIETLAENPKRGTIVYRVRWGFPKNIERMDLRYFELQVDNQQPLVFTNNTQETLVHLRYGHHSFSIVAVDRCNQRSQPTTCTLDRDHELTTKVQDEIPNRHSSANSNEVLSTTAHLLAVCFSFFC